MFHIEVYALQSAYCNNVCYIVFVVVNIFDNVVILSLILELENIFVHHFNDYRCI